MNEINQMTLNYDIIIYVKNVVESELLYEKKICFHKNINTNFCIFN